MKLKALTAAVSALAVLALPSVAAAHSKATPSSVRQHARTADSALDAVKRLVAQNDQATAAIELVENRLHTNAASREAKKLRRARGTRGTSQAISAWRLVANQQNRNVEAYASLVDDTSGRLQTQIATLVSSGLRGREQALGVLTGLIERLPAQARPAASRVVRVLSSDGQDELGTLFGALAGGSFPPDVQAILGRALDLATGALGTGLERLEELSGLLPPEARGPLQTAIATVEQTIGQVTQLLEGLLGSVPGLGAGGTGGLPDVGALLPQLGDVLPGLGGQLPDLGSLLGGLGLEGLDLGTLLGGLTGGTGGGTGGGGTGGGAGGVGGIGGLLEGLLGGLLGGLL